jgi:hypothetical protein
VAGVREKLQDELEDERRMREIKDERRMRGAPG